MSGAPSAVVLGARALDGLAMRMAAIAQNVASVGSARFQPVEVPFEDALRRASEQGEGAVEALRFAFVAGPELASSEDRRLDLMVSDAAQTSLRYSAVVDFVGRRLALTGAALGGQG